VGVPAHLPTIEYDGFSRRIKALAKPLIRLSNSDNPLVTHKLIPNRAGLSRRPYHDPPFSQLYNRQIVWQRRSFVWPTLKAQNLPIFDKHAWLQELADGYDRSISTMRRRATRAA
jgi:hypothetical protein